MGELPTCWPSVSPGFLERKVRLSILRPPVFSRAPGEVGSRHGGGLIVHRHPGASDAAECCWPHCETASLRLLGCFAPNTGVLRAAP